MMSGCVNIGIVNFKRNLEFRKQFLFTLYPRILSSAITVLLAFMLRNYWALVIGILSQSALTLILSYVMEPFRPRIAFSKIREIWSFSIWTLFKGIGGYVHSQIDKLAIGNFAGASGMGRYDVAQDVATSPTQELVTPLLTSLMPVMAKVQNDKRARRALYLNVLNWSAVICTSTSIGVALVSRDMAGVLLGPAWSDVGVLMPWFALSWGLLGMSNSVYSVLDTIGRPVISARLQWIRVFALAAAIVPVARLYGSLEAVVITRFVVTAAVTPTLFYALSLALEVPMRDFVAAIWRPAVAGLVMTLVVLTINAGIHFIGSPRLLLDIAAGAIAYAGSLMLLWTFVGRPEGVESDICQLVRDFILRRYGNRREIIGSRPQPSDDMS
jgi:O-antigen/teichoic acid export membrane protein